MGLSRPDCKLAVSVGELALKDDIDENVDASSPSADERVWGEEDIVDG